MLFSKEKVELQQKITSLEESLAAMTAERDTSNTELAAVRVQLTEATAAHETAITALKAEHETALGTLKAEHEVALAKVKTEADTRVELEVIDALAAAGVPESKLPARAQQGGATTYEAALKEYNALTDATEQAAYYAKHIAPFFARN